MVLPFEWLGGEPREMKFGIRFQVVIAGALLMIMLTAAALSQEPSDRLASPESFAAVADTAERSAALFGELGKVLTHRRCVNCHPASDHPRQGDQARLHQPPVERGADGHGLPAMRCSICHQQANFDPARVPGHPEWHLAPREMAWEGKSLGEICAQIKDRERNGGRSLEELVHHIGTDTLVGWAWAPGAGRRPAPGTQKQAGALVEAWVQTGAVCPK
jgi:cytochrome c5